MSKMIFLYNRGIGDLSWIDRHNRLLALLEPFFKTDQCAASVHVCGFPCGGYHYEIEMRTPDIESLLLASEFSDSVDAREEIQTLTKVVPFTKIVFDKEPDSEKH